MESLQIFHYKRHPDRKKMYLKIPPKKKKHKTHDGIEAFERKNF